MNKWLVKMIKTGRQSLTTKQTFFHYFFALAFPLSCMGLCFILLELFDVSAHQKSYIQSKVNTYSLYIGLAYFVRQYMSLSMSFAPILIDHSGFESIVNKMVQDNKWVIESKGDGFIVCTIPFKWNNWGTLMTFVKTDDGVLYNSICDLYNRPSTTSFGQNARNMKIIQKALDDASRKDG